MARVVLPTSRRILAKTVAPADDVVTSATCTPRMATGSQAFEQTRTAKLAAVSANFFARIGSRLVMRAHTRTASEAALMAICA